MYEIKTRETDQDVRQFIEKIDNQKKRSDAIKLLEIFSETTGLPAKMWGSSMIGFGSYHYRYASGHEGDAMITGFSPRKANFSLYLSTSQEDRMSFLARLGKHRAGKGCVYINQLADINENVLRQMILCNLDYIRTMYQQNTL